MLTRLAVRQARLIAFWLNVGLTGAMANTDKLTFSGETVNYDLGAFMEAYDPAAAFCSIDRVTGSDLSGADLSKAKVRNANSGTPTCAARH